MIVGFSPGVPSNVTPAIWFSVVEVDEELEEALAEDEALAVSEELDSELEPQPAKPTQTQSAAKPATARLSNE